MSPEDLPGRPGSEGRLDRLDGWLLVALLAAAALHAWAGIDLGSHPYEDAAMLMRYVRHLAEGQGIVWNPGEPPVDGATDFGVLVLAALPARLGLPVGASILLLGGLAHLGTVLLVYAGGRSTFRAGRGAALLSAGFLAVGPGTRYITARFGTPVFGLAAAAAFIAAGSVARVPARRGRALVFALLGLALGLVRPEGVILAFLLLLGVTWVRGGRGVHRVWAAWIGVFALLGGGYFLWRWSYFGHPLPNPFYIKGGGALYPDSLVISIRNVLGQTFPFWLVLLIAAGARLRGFLRTAPREDRIRAIRLAGLVTAGLGLLGLLRRSAPVHPVLLLGRYSPRYAGALAVLLTAGAALLLGARAAVAPLDRGGRLPAGASAPGEPARLEGDPRLLLPAFLGFTGIWLLLLNDTNYLGRFQYALLPPVLLTWPGLLSALVSPRRRRRTEPLHPGTRIALAVLGLALLVGQHARYGTGAYRDGRYEAAMVLRRHGTADAALATTDAGLLPYYSEWRSLDLGGLNDAWIAHNGGFTDGYLDGYDPLVIELDANFTPAMPPTPTDQGREARLVRYAESREYILAGAYEHAPGKAHYYYVHPGHPASAALRRELLDLAYCGAQNLALPAEGRPD